jgi:hypothetical protein
MIESVIDTDNPSQLRFHTWDGRQFLTVPTTRYCGRTYQPARIGGLAREARFPATSKSFGSESKLTSAMREFLTHYVQLAQNEIDLLIAFALGSHFVDCLPIAPVLFLLGPDNQTSLVLRLLACLCRRSVLLADIDIAALRTLPSQLDATLLINRRDLGQRLTQVLLASNNRHFCIARGSTQINAYGAKGFSIDSEFSNGIGVRLSLSPAKGPLPILTDADEKRVTNDFQAKLLRYRMVNYWRVLDAQIDAQSFVPEMQDEVRAWLAPIFGCANLQKSVSDSLLQRSREAEGARFADDRCVVAEAALFFCHKENTKHFFVAELADHVNALLNGRHEDRTLTDKKVGLLLRALGLYPYRIVQGYRIVLTEGIRDQIHRIAGAYQVISMLDGVARCPHCPNSTGTSS